MSVKHCVLDNLKHFKDMKKTVEKNIEAEWVLGEMFKGGENVR